MTYFAILPTKFTYLVLSTQKEFSIKALESIIIYASFKLQIKMPQQSLQLKINDWRNLFKLLCFFKTIVLDKFLENL